jgi:23S rRNA pseudouridine1911/1915/1917 synthase
MQKSSKVVQRADIDILYQDDNVLVINKPAGIAMHAKNNNDSSTTIHSIFASQLTGGGDPLRFGIVHRLDKNTSGVVIMAKTSLALKLLQEQFAFRTVYKQYVALVWGHLKHQKARIELPVRRSVKAPNIMVIHPGGKEAISEYRVVNEYQDYSLLEIDLHTGRTHQIRVQFAYIGHPIVGDKQYGKRPIPRGLSRQFLHAKKLTIKLPGQKKLTSFEAPLSLELKSFLEKLNE